MDDHAAVEPSLNETSSGTGSPVAVAALIRKRRDIAFEISQLEKATEQKRQELIHIDAVIHMLAPETDLSCIPERMRKPRRLAYFAHGEITRRIYQTLRGGNTVHASDITRQAMSDKGLDWETDRRLRIAFTTRITQQLNTLASKREVVKVGSGRGVRWRLPDALSDC